MYYLKTGQIESISNLVRFDHQLKEMQRMENAFFALILLVNVAKDCTTSVLFLHVNWNPLYRATIALKRFEKRNRVCEKFVKKTNS